MMLVSTRYDIRIYFITRSARLILSSDEAELIRKNDDHAEILTLKNLVRTRDNYSMLKHLVVSFEGSKT